MLFQLDDDYEATHASRHIQLGDEHADERNLLAT